MHYKVSVFLLLAFCALVGSKQYAGEPIRCSTATQDYSSMVEIYCFITSTYIVEPALDKTPAEGAPHPGIDQSQDKKDFRYHYYYQWVGFMLFFQAMLFYFPHWLWKNLEGGLLAKLVEKTGCESKDPEVQTLKHRNKIVNTVRNRWRKERLYCVKYFCCEFLCLANVVCQMFFLDKVFHNEFLYFGTEVAKYYTAESARGLSPMERLFPRVTSCRYNYFGEGGRVDSTSVLCVLAVNVINEKVFLFLWFWLVFLGSVTLFSLVYKTVVFSSKCLRLALLKACFRSVDGEQFRRVVQNGDIGDYLLIYLLGQNLEQSLFDDVIVELNGRFTDFKTS